MSAKRNKIHILDEVVANQIAAGEVVERPASVVKELVENSIDAGATRIEVEVEEGGKRLIRVADNGCGMSEEDAVLALQRHATSKIHTPEDLHCIRTLGFRGEALPSIAAVSELTLTTREPQAAVGVEVRVEGGVVTDFRRVGCPPGTTVVVRKLFYNTPARLKFLKTSGTEMGHITEFLSRFGLLYHQIAFRLVHNGQEVLSAPACTDLRNALVAIYGKDLAREMIPLALDAGSLRVRGYLGKPSVARGNRHYQAFFVNGRLVQSRVLSHALYEGYHTLLSARRHPIAVVIIEMDPRLVDVNVHPAKAEVRFTRDWEVHNLLQKAVREALTQACLLVQTSVGARARPAAPTAPPAAPPTPEEREAFRARLRQKFGRMEGEEVAPVEPVEDLFTFAALQRGERIPRHIVPLAQLKNTYILAETDEGLLIIDQHAAHERVIYEELRARKEGQPVQSQMLVIPFTLQLSPREARVLEENLETFEELGFRLEPFGKNAFLVRAVPLLLAQQPYERILRDVIDDLVAQTTPKSLAAHEDLVLRTMACKAAIKAGDVLSSEEIQRLVEQIQGLEQPFSCNHGRPTMLSVSVEELERKFQRS
ncbi:MAG TPA: DNA mismatch repair endonuclease MutL [Armatimonadetes bacterium]|nr:DNA mismatch repair endonuclease MutL [Armatimonadota bacterium]